MNNLSTLETYGFSLTSYKEPKRIQPFLEKKFTGLHTDLRAPVAGSNRVKKKKPTIQKKRGSA